MADPTDIEEICLEISIAMPDPQTGEADYRLIVGEEGRNVTRVEGWMLEAAQRAITVATELMKSLQQGLINQEIKQSRLMRQAIVIHGVADEGPGTIH